MKSIFITILLFMAVLLLIRFKVFDFLSSTGFMWASLIFLSIVLITAFKILGNPLLKKDKEHEK